MNATLVCVPADSSEGLSPKQQHQGPAAACCPARCACSGRAIRQNTYLCVSASYERYKGSAARPSVGIAVLAADGDSTERLGR